MNNAKNWLTWAGICLLFFGMLYGILALQQSEIREFRNEGLPAEATILEKREKRERTSQGDNRTVHEFDLSYFNKSVADETKIVDVGTYQTATIEVKRRSYNQAETGDSVNIIFLPDDPRDAKLAAEVKGWNGIGIYILMAPFVFGFFVCLIGATFAFFRS